MKNWGFKKGVKTFSMAMLVLIALAGVFLLAGCDGGGGGGKKIVTPTPPPQQNVPVQPVSDGLPPDPGAAGKATLGGIDTDGSGLRDELDRHIALTHPESEKKREVLKQYAIAGQNALLDAENKELAMKHAEEGSRASSCADYIFGFDESRKARKELKAQLLNTDERTRAYFRHNDQLGGEVFSLLPDDASSCDFDPVLLSD